MRLWRPRSRVDDRDVAALLRLAEHRQEVWRTDHRRYATIARFYDPIIARVRRQLEEAR